MPFNARLSDADKRKQYDQQGFAGVAGFSAEDLFSHIDLGDIFGDMGSIFGRDSVFDSFFSRGRYTKPVKGKDLDIAVQVSLERIATGGDEVIHFNRQASCKLCKGMGSAEGSPPRTCDACGGSGRKVVKSEKKGASFFQQLTTCPVCHGKGTLIDKPCKQCLGSGKTFKQETLTIKIPKGAEEGMMLRIPGYGLPASNPGLPSGDLYVCISSSPDSRFKRKGADLWHNETIDVTDAVLGTSLKVPTLQGYANIKIPAGTQSDEVFQLKGRGLPYQETDHYGDLNIRVHINIPTKLTWGEKALYKKLKDQRAKKEIT